MPKATEHNTTPAASRRNLLAMPGAALGHDDQDRALIALCDEHIANWQALNACSLDSDESPHYVAYLATYEAISQARPMTLAGLVAKAQAARREATGPTGGDESGGRVWAWNLVNDLIRIGGHAA